MLNEYLKKYRIRNNLSQKQMALKLETDQSYYSQIECGKRKPGFVMIRRISKVLNLEESFIRNLL